MTRSAFSLALLVVTLAPSVWAQPAPSSPSPEQIGAVRQAGAASQGGSNIGLTEYPGPSCTRPQLPPKPTLPTNPNGAAVEGASQLEGAYDSDVRRFNRDVAIYDAKIKDFNSAMKDFNSCMESYVDSGNADILRIKQKLDAAVAAAHGR